MTRALPLVLPAACLSLLTFGCEGGVETLNTLAPRIEMPACQPGGSCGVNIGDAVAGTTKLLEVEITNDGDAVLTIDSVRLSETTDPAFTIVAAPESLEAGEAGTIDIRFTPTVQGEVRGAFIIRSDASNVVCNEDTDCRAEGEGPVLRHLRLTLDGRGIAGGIPELTLDKVACDFGSVGIGASALCTISLGNDGDGDLLVDTVRVMESSKASGSAGDVFAYTAPEGQGIAPGTRASINVTFYPDAVGTYASIMEVLTNDPAQPSVQIALTGQQIDAPTCNIRIAAVNNIPVNGVEEVEPLDDVIVSALTSTPGSADAPIAGVTWTFVERPSGSTLEFASPGAMTTGFTFADGVLGVDLAGHYRIAAQVTDSNGTVSENLCEVAFNAVPQENLLVQLGWDAPTGDMDVHLVKMDNGGFCSTYGEADSLAQNCGDVFGTTDCNFSNCTLGGLDWDQDGAYDTEGDPSLDIDDLCGFGPENITLPTPEPGQYLVAIHYWSPSCGGGAAPVGNTVRVFLGGVLAYEGYKSLVVDEWWEAAIVHWPGPGGTPCVEPVDQPGTCN
jgi:hypothetical protein